MLRKANFPHLNRKQRRTKGILEPVTNLGKGFMSGANWLLAGLMIRAGIVAKVNPEGAQV